MLCPFCQVDNDTGDACYACGHTLATATMIRRGSLVASRFEILNPLGRGGMGMVYKAHDRALDDIVALKILRGDVAGETDMAKRFRAEIKLARKVRHRNTCGIHEYGEDGGLRFIVMELIEGTDLRQLIRQKGRVPAPEALSYAIQTAEGLAAIHTVGIIHRDLKTTNLMRDDAGLIRLMDFGIAKEWSQDVTVTGQIMGTPEYISPEQARGDRVDPRTDIYSLGVVIFELFTGDVPFHGDTAIATMFKHVHDPPPLDGERASSIPPPVISILRKSLAKEQANRQATVAELAEALRHAANEIGADVSATSSSFVPSSFTPTPSSRRDRAMNTTAAMTLAGDLRTMPFADILRWLGAGSKTGTLQLEGRSVQKRIVCRRGALSSSWSNDPRESLGQVLVRHGMISEEQLFKALLKQEDQKRMLGAILVEDGLLSEEELKVSMLVKAEETVHEVFLWSEGRFEFKDGDVPPDTAVNLEIPLAHVADEGLRQRDEWSRIRAKIPAGPVTFALIGDANGTSDPWERRVLDLAAKGKTTAEIGFETRRSAFDVCSCLYALCERGVLGIEQVGDEVHPEETMGAIRELLGIAEERFKERRFEAALDAYEAVLELDRLNQTAKKGLIAVFEARQRGRARRTVPLDKVPVLKTELKTLNLKSLDPHEGFMLARITGQCDVGTILKVCPMAEEDALLVLARLVDRKLIELR